MAQLTFQRARTDEKKRQRAAAIVEAARSLAVESGVTSVTLTAVANRAGVHYSLAAMLWQIAHPPEGLEHDYRSEPGVPPDWSLDFEPALTRLLTATCIGIVEQKH